METLKFKLNDTVQAKVMTGFILKCKIVDIKPDKNKFVFWLKTLESKSPFRINETVVADQKDLTMLPQPSFMEKVLHFDF